ncbi:hypothetical protein [Bradyrhizobium sp. AUGA SZCCT0160]|uniref:hypothetical protein n=1 Tax=Bradyrhizobium sp. AUGA SZCCT0160 TaxID=2807662 RepID=UPI001BA51004|nr:hypothetical protein [Bradyrhizobium sp. AUGA SZCCT0160]MBR1193222.1 hypothetical protein [Bradyrhizobium sp. AUGA SZCCT0160]
MAKPKDKHPWFKFFPANWRGNTKLRLCSIGARGLWMEMLCIMHDAEPYGHLVNNGVAVSNKQLAQLAGIGLTEVMKLMCELEVAGVYSRTDDKVIYSRKMVRDKAKAQQAKDWGSTGGNPELVGEDKEGVNPPVKGKDKPKKQEPHSNSKATAAAEAVVLDEGQEKQALALRVMLAAIRSGKKWSVPDLSPIDVWVYEGISTNTIQTACTPLLNRKEDMASLAYCDSAVRAAHAIAPHLQVVASGKVWVDEGTPEWACHQAEAFRLNRRGTPSTDHRDENGQVTGRRGWYFASQWPEGFNDFGERIAPAEENAA